MDNVTTALETISGDVMSGTTVYAVNFSQELLRQKLDSGSPVVYRSARNNSGKETGHLRVIYGYYWSVDANAYVYLTHEPWDPCKKYDTEGSTIGNNVHRDIWRRSWENIMNEKAVGISGLDRPETASYLTFEATHFYFYFMK